MRALYTAATGMNAQQLRIDNIAHNIANVSTTGFKKGRESFEDLIYQKMPVGAADGGLLRPSSLEIGSGTRMVALNRDFSAGAIQQSGETFDLALGGPGFFVVEDEAGQPFYTRDGNFGLNNDGEIVNSAGMRLSPGIRIPEDATSVTIAQDGTVTATFADSIDEVTLGTIRVVDVPNPAGLQALGGNLYAATPASGEATELFAEDGVDIQQGFLEASNVDIAEELVSMIVAQRAFELTSKVVTTADETMQTAVNMKR